MAVRFDADGKDYTRGSLPSPVTTWTVAGWFKVSVENSGYNSFFCLDNGTTTAGNAAVLQTNGSGAAALHYFDANGADIAGPVPGIGTWTYLAVAVNGTAGTLYTRAASSATFTTTALAGLSASLAAANLRIGESAWTGEWLNGCATAVKMWGATLTQAEVEQESWRYTPARTAGLTAWYPLTHPDPTDYSGNGRTLSGGTGVVFEDGPPLVWGAGPPIVTRVVATDQPPSVPTGLTSTDIRSTEVDLTWNASTDDVGVTGYELAIAPT